jgi:hypothetical protein
MLLQNTNDLLVAETGSLHFLSPGVENRLTSNRGHSRGAGHPLSKYDFELTPAMLARFSKCKSEGQFLHVLTTDKYTYAVCLATPKEGILFVQSNEGPSFLPLREFKQ